MEQKKKIFKNKYKKILRKDRMYKLSVKATAQAARCNTEI